MPKFARPNSYNGKQGNQAWTGQSRFATEAEAADGTSEILAISPATLASAVGDLVPSATTTTEGVVLLTDNNSPVATKVYVDAIAIAGAPAWSETVSGIGQLSTTAEAQAATNDNTAMTPLKVAQQLATPPAIGGTTPAAGTFTAIVGTTINASGLITGTASATITTGATALNLASDASTGAVNIGTGAAARTITIGNVTGATSVSINTGTGNFAVATTGAGDITLNSDDTVLIDADGVLELNSSAGVISIGNDADNQNMNLGTGGARVITLGNNTGATQLVLEAGSGGLDIGSAASAQSITIGNNTGATAIVMELGTGNFTLDGVGATTYSIGADTTTGTITIGGTAQTGTLGLGVSSGIMTTNLATGNGAKTLNVATGISGNTVNVATGANTSAQTINLASGASAADSTVNILSGIGTAGTQTLNVLTGTRAGALNLATGAAAHAIAIGSSSAAAATWDSAAGISIDAATASNFTVTGASENLTLASAGGSVVVSATENAAQAIYIHANGGITETIQIHSDQGTGAASVELLSDVGGITLTATGLASADAINLNAAAGGVDIDGALQVNIASSQDAADALRLVASAGGIDIDAVGAAGQDINILNTGGSLVMSATEAAADSVQLISTAGGIDISASGASAGLDIDITATGSSVNITATEATANAIVLNASDAAGGIDLTTGGGSVDISSSGFVTMVAATDSQAGATCTANTNVFACTYTGFTTAAAGTQTFTITNSVATTTSQLILSVCNEGSNDAQMTIQRIKRLAGSIEVYTKNNGAAALNGNVTITGWIIG